MTKLKLLFFALCCTMLHTVAFAQATITGNVIDNDTPLIGATVKVTGTGIGAITDLNGGFILNDVPSGEQTLNISYVGYETLEQDIMVPKTGSKNIGNIILNYTNGLDAVVVTALGIERDEKSLGYSVSELNGAELIEAKETNLVNSLNGKVAGVQITNGSAGVGSSSRIVIRGEASLNSQGNDPLFIVDGIPINNTPLYNTQENSGGSEMQEVDWGNGAADINSNDIASISVLKGPTSAALYGSRGANGVVLITTKSGVSNNNKKMTIGIDAGLMFDNVLRLPEYQNKYGQGWAGEFAYVDGLNNSIGVNDQEDVSWGPIATGQPITQFDSPATGGLRAGDIFARGWVRNPDGSISSPSVVPNDLTATPFNTYEDNVKNFFETGITNNLNASIQLNNNNSDFYFSLGRIANDGLIPNTGIERMSYRANGDVDLSDKLKLSTRINYIDSSSDNRPASGYGSESAMYMFTWYGRTVNTESLKEYWQRGYEGLEQYNYNYAWHDNPYFTLNENTNAFNKDRVLGNVKLSYKVTDDLTAEVRTGIDYYSDNRKQKRAYSTQRFLKGAYREENSTFREQNTDILLRYNKDVNDTWNFGVNAGGNIMKQKRSLLSNTANSLVIPNIYNLQNSGLPLITNHFNSEKQINSIYGILNASYNDYLFLDVTARNDWSSTLPENNNSYFYPSVSLSGIVSEMTDLPSSFDFVKVRGSIAKVGNDTDPYKLVTPFIFKTPYGGSRAITRGTTLFNENLKPESVTSYEIGTDIRMFDNRAGLDFTYYNSISENQIFPIPVSNTVGFTDRIINGGKVRNSGIEAMLTLTPVANEDFTWTSNINFGKNKGTVEELIDGTDVITTNYASVYDAETSKVFVQARKGERTGNMYGLKFERDPAGRIIYGSNGKPVVADGLQLLGNYNPDFSMGFQNELNYKDVNLSFLFDWKKGGQIISRTKQIATYAGNLSSSENRNDYNDIVPDGVKEVNGQYVALTEADAVGWWGYYKPLYDRRNQQETGIVDADYVKLREVKLGYNLPNELATKLGMSNIRASLVGRNLALWTPESNPHFDPETLALQGANIVPGIEDVSYPSARSMGVNLSIKF